MNKRAHKVLERFGFKKTGRARKSGFLFGKRLDWVMFDLLKEEYMGNRQEYLDEFLADKDEYINRACRLTHKKKSRKEDEPKRPAEK